MDRSGTIKSTNSNKVEVMHKFLRFGGTRYSSLKRNVLRAPNGSQDPTPDYENDMLQGSILSNDHRLTIAEHQSFAGREDSGRCTGFELGCIEVENGLDPDEMRRLTSMIQDGGTRRQRGMPGNYTHGMNVIGICSLLI